MNPLVITGILAVTVASVALLISFSNEQVRYSGVIERTSTMQVERLQEDVTVGIRDGQLVLKNTGPVHVQIMEVRLIDEEGNVVMRQKVNHTILAAQSADVSSLDPQFIRSIRAADVRGVR